MRVLRKWTLLLSLAFAPLPALAQPCGGFSDVTPADFYCNNVEWLKNRAVTLGCTNPPGAYCENDFVLRSQMAAFMNRLGDALAPTIQRTTNVHSLQTYDPPNNAVYCISTPFVVTGFPRQASFAATLMNYNASATKTVQAGLVFSTDAGANWAPTGDFVMWQTVDPAERTTLAIVGGSLPLIVDATYQFAIQTGTNEPSATVSGECQLNIRIESRTGTGTPF